MRPILERFLEKVRKTDGCWFWEGLKNKKGYGRFGVPKARGHGMELAHRFAWTLFIGAIPKGLCILHGCDNPACVRPGPGHLFLGTRAENNADARAKGRAKYVAWQYLRPEDRARGERVAKVMTDEKVRCLRNEYALGGTSFVKLGLKYGIGHTTVENIVKRRKWAHVR